MRIGIDIVAISRIERLIGRFGERGLARYLAADEIALAKTPRTAAGFWAAKEAVAKALGCGIGTELSFHDIILSKTLKGAPQARLVPEASARFHIRDITLSITHDADIAAAVALIA